MPTPAIVAATRQLPPACEERLRAQYTFVPGDDSATHTAEALAHHARDAAALLVTPVDALNSVAVALLPSTLRVISTVSVGYEHIALDAAKARGIRVTHTPGVLTDATADVAMLLILAATRRASEGERILRAGSWIGIRPTQLLGMQITGKRLGIVGMGRIGAAVARRARAFGMDVLYYNRRPSPEADAVGARYVASLATLLPQSDVLSLHAPLTPETKGLLNAERIALLPDGAIVVNTARGGLVDDDALIGALTSGKLFAAGLDVYNGEPALDPRYRTLENAVLLPHLGSATIETRTAMGMLAIDNIDAVLNGREPPYPVV